MKRSILLAALCAAAAGACGDGTTGGGGPARTRVYLTDGPFPWGDIARVDVFVRRIDASPSLDTASGGAVDWTTVASPARVFNLLDLQQGTTALLGEGDLPAGRYRAVRVVINTALSRVVRNDGSLAPVQWPVAGELALHAYVEHALDVPAAGASIVIDFDVGRTFLEDGAGGFVFIPWIRAVNESATGSVAGTVRAHSIEGVLEPFPGAHIMVLRDDSTVPQLGAPTVIIGTGRTDAQGRFTVAYLTAGQYRVVAEDPAYRTLRAGSDRVSVTAGARRVVDLVMRPDTGTGGGVDTTGGGGGGGGGTPTGPVASITISPPTQSVAVGDSVPILAITKNAQDEVLWDRTVTWSVSDTTRARVHATYGNWLVLRALAPGSVTVTATSEGRSASGAVVVR